MKEPTSAIYQLKIQVAEIDPPIWRRILLRGETSLAQLHQLIQTAFGWSNYHLHEFRVDGESYSDPEAEIDDSRNEFQYRLDSMAVRARKVFGYLYDFGDGWDHIIMVEKIAETDKRFLGRPVCIAGARACPPEDCGGPYAYQDLLEVLANPKHKRHKEMRQWIGDDFDAEHFDLVEVNEMLNASVGP